MNNHTPLVVNPFIYGPPVPPEKFIGREREVDFILDRLANPYNRGGSAVSGRSGIGKTSLLHYLASNLARSRSNELNPETAHFAYIPLGFISPFSETGFWEYLFDELEDWLGANAGTGKIRQALEAGKPPSRYHISKFFETLGQEKNRFVVVLLDGFDLLISEIKETGNKKAGEAFLQTLRSLLNLPAPRGFSLITSSEQELFELFKDFPLFGSAFYTNMATLPLEPFTPPKIETLLNTYLAGTGIEFDPVERQQLKEQSQGHPKKLQEAAYHLFEEKTEALASHPPQPAERPPDVDFAEFDVFLAHNSQDKPQVEAIARQLIARGLKPWLDKWHLPPGRRFAEEIERILPKTKAAAVFVGPGGTSPWQEQEIYLTLDLFAKEARPVIPVLLPGVESEPDMPLFLRQFSWVRFGGQIDDPEALDNLQWGITGVHPTPGSVLDRLVQTVLAAYHLLAEIAHEVFEAGPTETGWPIAHPNALRPVFEPLDLETQNTEIGRLNVFTARLKQHKTAWNDYRREAEKPECPPVVKTALQQAGEVEATKLKEDGAWLKQHLEDLTGEIMTLPGLE